jgi:hypothetical protein
MSRNIVSTSLVVLDMLFGMMQIWEQDQLATECRVNRRNEEQGLSLIRH